MESPLISVHEMLIWCLLDSSVTSIGNQTTIVTTAAYLLFYRRRTNKPLGGPIFENIMGDSKAPPQEEEPGNGGADNGNDSGISDNSSSSSPRMLGGRIGGRDSPDNSRSSPPLVSGRAGSSTTGYRSFGGAGSNSNLFEAAPLSVLPPSPVLSGSQGPSSSALPPSYTETFGPQLPVEGVYGPQVAPKVSFTFGGRAPGTPTSTAGEVGDSDRDADAEEDTDMFADLEDVREGSPAVEHNGVTEVVISADEGLGEGDDGGDGGEPGAVHDVELSPERDDDKGGMDLDA